MDTPAAEPTPDKSAADQQAERTHDVTFTTSERRFYFYNADRGVTLAADHIAWTFNNKDDSAWYKSIAEVRLQTGGGWMSPTHICEMTFADGYRLLVTDNNEFGVPIKIQRAAYRGFVHDLHARLVAHAAGRTGPPIVFKAGYDRGRHRSMSAAMMLLLVVFIGIPLAGLLFTGEVKPFFLLIGAVFVSWPLWRMIQNNAPRSYDPARPPKDLVG